jgi:hypothetical protein
LIQTSVDIYQKSEQTQVRGYSGFLRIDNHGSQRNKNQFSYIYIYITTGVVKFKNQIPTHRTACYYWFFHENGPFFNVFEIPMTDGSLLHKCLKSWWFFINSNNCTTLVQTSDKNTHTHTHTLSASSC